MYFVYFLVCVETGRTSVGHTDNLLRRFAEHRAGVTRTTREKLRRPVVAHWESFPTRAEAMRKEKYYKSGSGHRVRIEMIATAMRALA